ncbi:MAG: methionyl-tRNA formyltransferase [Xanthomonadales bacterium]|nr:methionyl-tRNA formyltransferase [Xanthomonadales bacterium]MDL1867874.1 methionyl-tRNA formyltransferase [Gammaproteobacteria bacterium PRO6]
MSATRVADVVPASVNACLTVFAMTRKGHAVLEVLLRRFPGLVAAVVVGRDAALDDDHVDRIVALCGEHGVPVSRHGDRLALRTPYALAVSWRWLIEPGATRLIVMHDSLLPRHRGFNPLVTALIEGDRRIGVTALYASAEYDRGDIIAQAASDVTYPLRIADAIEQVCGHYQELALHVAACLVRGEMPPATPQDDAAATYSLWRDDEDYFIDWTLDAARLQRTVDALGSPYHGAASLLSGRLVRIHAATALADVIIANRTPGKVIFVDHGRPVVVCGYGLLRIDALVDGVTGDSLLPLQRFRVRFGTR